MRSKSHRDFAREEAEPLGHRRGIQRCYLHQRLARLGKHERFALDGLIDQLRELSLGFVNVDGDHVDLQD
jgi:hypothetical protein